MLSCDKIWHNIIVGCHMGNKIGYARVSSRDQKLDSQLDMLKEAGCMKVFCDKASGIKQSRPGWDKLIEYIRPGDSLVVAELSRMTRSLAHLLSLIDDFETKKISMVSLRENIDTSTATGRAFISIMGVINQMERELRAERTEAGRKAARARGKSGGRPKTDYAKLEKARILYEEGRHTVADICKSLGIGRRTFYRHLEGIAKAEMETKELKRAKPQLAFREI